ncbi:GGDEF domain-containing protein [Shewanella benthica]|uniref:GGDEF domain-containing protein n=1 Tax=Shewanella benthica TaxID=43661 RepID=UPI0018791504|nr:GGDEF domain-containing protein [Shewanella benthica]MBE7214639.1 GGDEF domain-containing protein [Shewanella benthica]MCL1060550.1 GGDEF domain-containing protein [Shewanella benthica]
MDLESVNKIPRNASVVFHVFAIVTLSVFSLYRIGVGDYKHAGFFSLAITPLLFSLLREWQYKANVLQKQITLIMVSIGICYSCFYLGYKGLIYLFPTIFIYFFLFNIKQALILSILYALFGLGFALNIEPTPVIARYSIAIIDCIVFGALFSHIINKQKSALFYLAHTDELTGVYNRKRLKPSLNNAIESRIKHQTQTSLLLLDLDHFKQINDTHGHITGDSVLRAVADTITRHKPVDAEVIRFGGEEFLIKLPNTDGEHAVIYADQLRQAISQIKVPGVSLLITCSIGVKELEDESVDEWLNACDKALYKAKSAGRNRVIQAS